MTPDSQFCCNESEVYGLSFLGSLSDPYKLWKLMAYLKVSTAGTAQPLLCVWAAVCLVLLSLWHSSDLGKCDCCTQNPSLGNCFKHTAKSQKPLNQAKSSLLWEKQHLLTTESVNPSYTPRAFLAPWPVGAAMTPEQDKGLSSLNASTTTGVISALGAWLTWRPLPS